MLLVFLTFVVCVCIVFVSQRAEWTPIDRPGLARDFFTKRVWHILLLTPSASKDHVYPRWIWVGCPQSPKKLGQVIYTDIPFRVLLSPQRSSHPSWPDVGRAPSSSADHVDIDSIVASGSAKERPWVTQLATKRSRPPAERIPARLLVRVAERKIRRRTSVQRSRCTVGGEWKGHRCALISVNNCLIPDHASIWN